MANLRIAGIANDSIVDGPGLRYTIFTQGCPHHCKECHNPETHDPSCGKLIEIDSVVSEVKKNPLLDGITLSGGEPFMQAEVAGHLARKIKKDLNLSVITYTGFLFEDLLKNDKNRELLENTDMLVDGKFVKEEKSLDLMYRGSKNQRLINVQESLKQNKVIEYNINKYGEIL